MQILKYTKFQYAMIAKKWSIYITIGLYLFIQGLFMYLFPAISDRALNKVYMQHGVLIVIGLFAGMAATTLVIQIFRTGIDDGTDLLVLAKPINKATVLWVKFFVFISYVIMTAGLLSAESSFTLVSAYNEYNFAYTIIIGSFIGTFVIMLLWGGLSIILTVFYKKFGTFLFSISIQAFILIVAVVFSVVIVSPGTYLQDQKKIFYQQVPLLSQPNKDGESTYKWGYYSYANSWENPITEETKFNGMSLKQYGVNLSDFNQLVWNQAQKHTNRNVLNNLDLNNQLVTMFYFQNQHYFKEHLPLASMLYAMNSNGGASSFYNIEFGDVPANKLIESVNPNIYKNKFNHYMMLVANQNYVVQPNHYITPTFTNTIMNSLSGHETGNFNFNFNFNSVLVPSVHYDASNNVQIEFKDVSSPDEMIKTIFTKDFVRLIDDFNQVISNSVTPYVINTPSLLFTLLNARHVDNSNSFTNFESVYKSYRDELFNEITKIQYWSYIILQNVAKNPEEYPWFDRNYANETYSLLSSNIDTKTINFRQAYYFLFSTVKDFQQIINTKNFGTNFVNNWGIFRPQLALVNANLLPTLTTAQLNNAYNMDALISCWTVLGVVFSLIGLSLFMKRDFS